MRYLVVLDDVFFKTQIIAILCKSPSIAIDVLEN